MKKKVLFIDRDGTIIIEPPTDYQVDSLEKLEFLPFAISSLQLLAQSSDFELVMVTNQDGLGTDSYPEDTFWPAHNKMLKTLEGEGITFVRSHIDKTFESEGAETRKPGIGLLKEYFDETKYDLANSFVIGDRETDVKLAENLGCKSIFIGKEQLETATFTSFDWREITSYLMDNSRTASVIRNTKETKIEVVLNLDGVGNAEISTGLNFFDHMLDQIGKHSVSDLYINTQGDLEIDEHHTIEDTAIALGQAFKEAIGSKKGIERYGFLLPMDDCLAQVAIDFGGRPWIEWDVDFKREKVGDLPTEMVFHFFKSFSDASACNLNIKASGDNEHHKIESIFKAFAKAIKMAKTKNVNDNSIPSTKGVI